MSQTSRIDTNVRQDSLSVESVSRDMELYIQDPPIERNSNPLHWWAQHASRFKTLSFLARAFLSIPATQTKSERLNSTSGLIVEDRRSNLLTEHVTELTFLHENL